jgi:hypothetical protein
MSEYLRHTADHISWLMRQKRREVAETAQLASHLSRVLQRRGQRGGLAAILGPDQVRHAAGIIPLTPAETPQGAYPEPEPATAEEPLETPTPEPEPAAAPEPQPPEPVEAEAEPLPEPEPQPEPEPEPEPELAPEPVEEIELSAEAPEPSEQAEPPVEEPEPEQRELLPEGPVEEVEEDIRAAAAEAAAVEGIPTGRPEAVTTTAAPPEQEATEEPAGPYEEAVSLAETVAEIQGAPGQPAAGAPGLGPAADEVPFEAALEPQALIPAETVFARAADRVLFDRAIENLGMGEASGLRDGIEMLGHIPSDAAAQVLMSLYEIAPQRWRSVVVHQLVMHPGAGIDAFFCRLLERGDEPAIVRSAALRGLYTRDKALAADHLLRALGDPSEEIRETAAMYLGWLRDKRAIPLLEQLAAISSERVAKVAFHAAAAIQR